MIPWVDILKNWCFNSFDKIYQIKDILHFVTYFNRRSNKDSVKYSSIILLRKSKAQ